MGTQVALIDQAFLISDKGEQVLSPLINSIQLRAYLMVDVSERKARPKATQCVAEFVTQPRQLMRGKAVMRAVGPEDRRYKTLGADGGKVGVFEPGGHAIRPVPPRLRQCLQCHGNKPGVHSLGDFVRGDRFTFEEGSPVKIGQAIAAAKREDETWKTLQKLWPRESSPKDDGQSNAASKPIQVAQASSDAEPKTADKSKGLYHPDPDHLWNRLHRDIFVRKDPGAQERIVRVLREFLEKDGHTLIDDSLKKAFLQHDLWAYFDPIIAYFMEAERESSEVPTLMSAKTSRI